MLDSTMPTWLRATPCGPFSASVCSSLSKGRSSYPGPWNRGAPLGELRTVHRRISCVLLAGVVGVGPAIHGVVAADPVSGLERVVAPEPLQDVGSTRSRQGVGETRAAQPLHTREGVCSLACRELSRQRGDYTGGGGGVVRCVQPRSAVVYVVTEAAAKLVVAGTAQEDVVAVETLYGVVATKAAEHVLANGATYEVVARRGSGVGALRYRLPVRVDVVLRVGVYRDLTRAVRVHHVDVAVGVRGSDRHEPVPSRGPCGLGVGHGVAIG